MNCADHNGVNDIRELRPLIRNKALDGEYRAWILDECHRLTPDAQSALLKMLEEPPSHVLFFLCTTDSQKLLGTILSRCMRLIVEALTEQQTVILLSNICKKEKKSVPKEVLSQIAIDSLGHPRDALSILESIIDLDIKDMELSARKVAEQQNAIIDLCQSLYKKKRWNEIAKILSNLKDETETIRRSVLGYCNSILLKGDNPWAYIIMDCFKETFFYTGKPGLTLACYEALEAIKENK